MPRAYDDSSRVRTYTTGPDALSIFRPSLSLFLARARCPRTRCGRVGRDSKAATPRPERRGLRTRREIASLPPSCRHGRVELGIGDATLIKALAEASGKTEAAVKASYAEEGDLGIVAVSAKAKQAMLFKPKPLTRQHLPSFNQGVLADWPFASFEYSPCSSFGAHLGGFLGSSAAPCAPFAGPWV